MFESLDNFEFAVQNHDLQPGVRPDPNPPSDDPSMSGGLFWTTQIPDDSFWVSRDGRHARLRLHELCLVDSFQFNSKFDAPARISCDVRWRATDKAVARGLGTKGDPAAGTAWEGQTAPAHATGWFKAWSMGYEAEAHTTSDPNGFKAPLGGWAQLGTERNGHFLDGAKKSAPPKQMPPKDHDHKKASARGHKK